jgi:hypothetical protein
MFDGWSRRVMVGMSVFGGLAYVGVFTADCRAKEPGDVEPAPVGAMFAPATTVAVSDGLTHFVANMTGDEPIKQTRSPVDETILKILLP